MVCPACRPDLFPTCAPLTEGHMAFRFRDAPDIVNCHVLPYLNGEPARHCVEVCPAPCGFVVVMHEDEEGRLHRCACGNGMEARVLVGNVTMAMVPWKRHGQREGGVTHGGTRVHKERGDGR